MSFMASILVIPRSRRILRRAARGRCQAVGLDGFRLLGERYLDLSPYGMLLACDAAVQSGEEVIVSFQVPGAGWFDAEAAVVRVVEGWREGDPGYCIGLEFTRIGVADRLALAEALRGTPPPVPLRHLRVDYAESVLRVARAA